MSVELMTKLMVIFSFEGQFFFAALAHFVSKPDSLALVWEPADFQRWSQNKSSTKLSEKDRKTKLSWTSWVTTPSLRSTTSRVQRKDKEITSTTCGAAEASGGTHKRKKPSLPHWLNLGHLLCCAHIASHHCWGIVLIWPYHSVQTQVNQILFGTSYLYQQQEQMTSPREVGDLIEAEW